MDYSSYRRCRDALLRERPDLLRLDCMNPVVALAFARTEGAPEACEGPPSPADLVSAWSQATGVVVPECHRVIGTGVRDLLGAAFEFVAEAGDTLWLPADVYPVYWELARQSGLRPRAFRTMPRPDWSFLESIHDRATVLLPMPLSPLGRALAPTEVEALRRWLEADGRRTLLLDTVYAYDFLTTRRVLEPLAEMADRCAILWSCAKSWLRPGALGVGQVPTAWRDAMLPRMSAPAAEEGRALASALTHAPHLPAALQGAFRGQWRRLTPRVRAVQPTWQPPETGYFAVLELAFERLHQQHGILAVPATVFGSSDAEVSVVTCLHDMTHLDPEGKAP